MAKDEGYYLTLLGALLHDVGKLGWRAAGGGGHKHQHYSKEFVSGLPSPILPNGKTLDMEKLEKIVSLHHEDDLKDIPSDLRTIIHTIQVADWRSSMMEREESPLEEPEEPLESLFEKICICRERKDHRGEDTHVYRPAAIQLDKESIFPVKRSDVTVQEMRDRSRKLWEDMMLLRGSLPKNVDSYIDTLYYILKKYTSFTLSAGYRARPTAPLFDHLKATAAIATCLYRYCREKGVSPLEMKQDAFALVLGDISGIQDFIFKVYSPEEARKEMARRLRGRSLEISLIMDAAAHRIAEELGLPECNILWCTGGQFSILAPSHTVEEVEVIVKRLNKELWKKFEGALYLTFGIAKASLLEKGWFRKALLKCEEELDGRKGRRFLDVLEDGYPDAGTGDVPKYRCPSCGRDSETGEICERCEEQADLGQQLVKAEVIFRGEGLTKPDFSFAGFSYKLMDRKELHEVKDLQGMVYMINSTDFHTVGDGVGVGFIFMGNTAPKYRGDILSFDYLAELSRGAGKLGLAKGDVDNMGYIIHSGIEEVRIRDYSNMSSLLDLFFAGYLNRILERYYTYPLCPTCKAKLEFKDELYTAVSPEGEDGGSFVNWWVLQDGRGREEIEGLICEDCKRGKTPVIYVNYSGGDDFLIIGPWDAVIMACVDIREEFGKFVCGNPDLGLSIGYTITDPKFPIAIAVETLSSNLKRAKRYRSEIDPSACKKDMASLFGDCVYLSERDATGSGGKTLKSLVELAKELEEGVRSKEIPRGFIHDLISLCRSSFYRSADPKEIERRRREVRAYVPILKYKMVRTLKNMKYDEIITDSMPWILIPACWVSLRTRSRRD